MSQFIKATCKAQHLQLRNQDKTSGTKTIKTLFLVIILQSSSLKNIKSPLTIKEKCLIQTKLKLLIFQSSSKHPKITKINLGRDRLRHINKILLPQKLFPMQCLQSLEQQEKQRWPKFQFKGKLLLPSQQ